MEDRRRDVDGATVGAPPSGTDPAGEQLRRLRRERGVSLVKLARSAFYSKGYLSKVENGEKPLTLELARACDQALETGGALERIVLHPTAGGERPRRREDDEACPYQGLSPFEQEDARWYFGREETVAHLASRLAQHLHRPGPLVLTAPSGAGKSSLLRAGLITALRRGVLPVDGSRNWPVSLFTPGEQPVAALLEQLAATTGASRRALEKSLQRGPGELAAMVRAEVTERFARAPEPETEHTGPAETPAAAPRTAAVVVIVDQFEEVFTLCQDAAERSSFIETLTALTEPPAPEDDGLPTAVVVLGMRADFYDRCLAFPGLASSLQDGHVALGPLSDAALREVIVGPARAAGLTVGPGLVEVLCRDLGRAPTGEAAGNPSRTSVLPFLSHALLGTWQHREGTALTVAGYQRTGGICEAVAATAEQAYVSLPAELRPIARRVLLQLVRIGEDHEASRRAARSNLLEGGTTREAVEAVLGVFIQARMLTADTDHVGLAHEVLLHAWPRLRQWIDEDRADLHAHQLLAEAAALWDQSGRDPSMLYRGNRLSAARDRQGDPGPAIALPAVVRRFLEASAELEATEERRDRDRVKRLRLLVSGLATLLVLTLVAGTSAFVEKRSAEEQRRMAASRELSARADLLNRDAPEAATLSALSAYRQAHTGQARGSIISAYARYRANEFTGHDKPVNAVAYSPDGRTLATASDDHTVKLWNVTSKRLITTLRGHTRGVDALAFSPDGKVLASGGEDGSAKLWHLPTNTVIATLAGHRGAVLTVVFSRDGGTLVTAGHDRDVKLWDTVTHQLTATLSGHTQQVMGAAFSADGRTLATVCNDHTVKLWDTATRKETGTLTGHSDSVMAVAFSADDRILATASADRTTMLWETATNRPLAVLTGHTDQVMDLAFSPTDRRLATASYDGTVRLWDPATGESTTTLRIGQPVQALAFSPDGRHLATALLSSRGSLPPTAGGQAGRADGTRIWDVSSGQAVATFPNGTTPPTSAVVSPDGRTLAVGDTDGLVTLWNLADDQPIVTLTGHSAAVTQLAFAPDGRTLASGSADRTVRQWNLSTFAEDAVFTGHGQAVLGVAFSPDGQLLAAAGADHTTRLWDTRSRRLVDTIIGDTDSAATVAFSPDGRTLASGNYNGSVRLWDVPARRTTTVLRGQNATTWAVAFSHDGRLLATAGADGDIRLWDAATHRPVTTLTGHTGEVRALAFSPDGRTLASGGADRTVRLWDTTGRRTEATLTGHEGDVTSVAFAPDGHTLATTSADRTVRLWELDADAVATRICQISATHQWPAKGCPGAGR
ncbi:hypothetical protein BLA24_27560 [Streptomyces cinnamoneus]|uniref:HTH cro/C1-type domain-containing protein n=2 Tax=Streptomyces cinnamoneus TaxID=53446 RepID=A0A2G1XC84_STRCJ|nr:helix-turn-helix domain-containing protein [Streptomyces cinnamoneus]PHQ48828.1 hypothetical protein BLA24_27560 [Streptomyces cinnamoneus]PPT14526.1 DNA-binding protein [Streptomyces cinnamoneus]